MLSLGQGQELKEETSCRPLPERRYLILVPPEMSDLERIALGEFRSYLGQVTGQDVSVMERGSPNLEELMVQLDFEAVIDPVFILGTPGTSAVLAELAGEGGIRLLEGLGPQEFLIETLNLRGRRFVVLAGGDSVGVSYALYEFLETCCGVGFFPDGVRVPSRGSLLGSGPVSHRGAPRVSFRMHLVHPFWSEPYAESSRLWSIEEWKTLIDWMRRKKLNALLAFHDEGTYLWGDAIFRAFPQIPRNERTLREFVMLPEYRTELVREIFSYARQSGIHIVYNLMYPQVPEFVREFFSGLDYHEASMSSLNICASQKECFDLISRYWGEILSTFGIDESHLYVVSPYLHERLLCDKFADRSEPALQAYGVLKELDPQAQVLVENWSWPWGDWPSLGVASREWKALLDKTPPEVGVFDLDRRFNLKDGGGELFGWYRPRNWAQVVMSTLEGAYPPSGVMLPLQDLIYVLDEAIAHGAAGIGLFNIMARGNEMLSNLAAELGWKEGLTEDEFLKGYVEARFGGGGESAPHSGLRQSVEAYLASIDGAILMPGFFTMGYRPLSRLGPNGAYRGFEFIYNSAERQLEVAIQEGTKTPEWLEEKLQFFESKAILARTALACAREAAPGQRGNSLFDRYLWELEYVDRRWKGVIALYRAHSAESDPDRARGCFEEAVKSLSQVKNLYAGRKEYSMSALPELAPEVRYNPYFLENRDNYERRNSFWREFVPRFHVVWERFDAYERYLLSLMPKVVSDPTNRLVEAP